MNGRLRLVDSSPRVLVACRTWKALFLLFIYLYYLVSLARSGQRFDTLSSPRESRHRSPNKFVLNDEKGSNSGAPNEANFLNEGP